MYKRQVVKSFDPKTYGELIAKMSKTESGESRVITKVILVVNPTDYFQKVMPSTTVLTASGAYVSDVFPFATEVFQSAAVAEGKAVLFVEMCIRDRFYGVFIMLASKISGVDDD